MSLKWGSAEYLYWIYILNITNSIAGSYLIWFLDQNIDFFKLAIMPDEKIVSMFAVK